MNYITHKISTERTATASARVICNEQTFFAIKNNQLPKGSPFDICLASGLLAAKQTPHLIPHCHPLIIDGLKIEFHLSDSEQGKSHFSANEFGVWIRGIGKCVGKTGIEMEILTAVSVSALTLYDLLKPLGSKDLVITDIRLLEKTGGKSQQKPVPKELKKAVLLNLSNRTPDKITPFFSELLEKNGIEIIHSSAISDLTELPSTIIHWAENNCPLIFTLGMTSAHQNLANYVKNLMNAPLDGIVHAMYHHGYQRTPESVDSSLMAGFVKNSLLITLPGSRAGAEECLEAIMPSLFHPLSKKRGQW